MSLVINGKYIYDASGKIVEVILPIDQFQELRRRAASAAAPIEFSEQALAGREELSAKEMTQIAVFGGAFDWLRDEPDLYTDADGEAV